MMMKWITLMLVMGLVAGKGLFGEGPILYCIERVENCVWMMEGWMEVYKRGDFPMLITTYEEFHDNPDNFFEKILNFYGIPLRQFRSVELPKNWKFNYRKGEKEEWRSALTLEQITRINDQIPDHFFEFFGWDRF